MKILQINRYHHPMGGSETVYFNTTELLKSRGHEVSFFAMDYPENIKCNEKEFFAKAFDFNTLSFKNKIKKFSNFFYNKNAERSLDRLIKQGKPDVAHLHLFYGSLTSSILATLKKRGIPVVITAHEYRLICPVYVFLNGKNEICEKCQGRKFINCFTNKCAKNSYLVSLLFSLEAYYRNLFYSPKSYINKILFVSKFTMKKHLQYRPELKDSAVQLYNFTHKVPTKHIDAKKGDYFLYLGRLSYEKGLLNLVEAFNNRPQYKLKIAGSGPLLNDLIQKAKGNIEFSGFAKGAELENLINNCSFVVVPSEWYETFGMSALEALVLGKPVIAANIGGLPEVIEDQKNGFLYESFSLDDLLNKIDTANATSTEEYRILSEYAINTGTRKFSENKHYEELMKVYHSVIENK